MFENAAISSLGAGILIPHNDSIVLVQINYGKGKGKWILPGGTVDKGEHPEDAAARELQEETGLTAEVTALLGVRHKLNGPESGDSNVYFGFEGRLAEQYQDSPESHFKWDPSEIISVKMWNVQDALKSTEVQPLTKVFIEMFNNSNDLFTKKSSEYATKFASSIFGS